jgi:hypothetical protein
MKKTLQDQYLLIKEGKGHKGVFLAEAKRDFPHIVPNAATFEEAAACLKTKNIISENIVGLSVVAGYEPKKKESYETAFEAFLAEAKKKKENEDEKVKAEEKKVSKHVEEDLEHNFNNKDNKNPDNLIFDQIMMGYYAEMKDPKNAEKTMQELKDMVFKNLAKDPIYYTKDGQFGVKGLGYTTEAPGLGTPKEATGKYKSSGYGNLSENKAGAYEETYDELKKQLTTDKENKFSPEDIKAKLKKKREEELERRKKAGESLEEITLRKAIQEMIDAELEEGTYQMVNIRPRTSDKERGEGEDKDKYAAFTNDEERALRGKGDLLVKKMNGEDKVFISAARVANLPKIWNPTLKKVLTSAGSYTKGFAFANPTTGVKQEYWMLDPSDKSIEVYINSKGRVSVYIPISSQKSLKESVEKELAAINKEAEHEILDSKLEKVQALIDKKQSQLGKLDEDEDMKALTDAKKVKEIQKDIKALEKAKAKLEKMMGKTKGKKKEVIDETDGTENSNEYPDTETAEQDWMDNSDMGQSDFE